MILTEEEARKKTCHKTLNATVIAGEANYYPCACYASDCMAWRWAKKLNPDYKHSMVQVWPSQWPPNEPYITDDEHGYCGLAGSAS